MYQQHIYKEYCPEQSWCGEHGLLFHGAVRSKSVSRQRWFSTNGTVLCPHLIVLYYLDRVANPFRWWVQWSISMSTVLYKSSTAQMQ